ncbi:DUF6807 family protein [Microbacterium trichothecenolyticum]|uniref:DUF6807 family protein n=1 Tax=Microbacterium trichothecenolyticum TaxID=69370 RepID=UPI0035BE1A41
MSAVLLGPDGVAEYHDGTDMAAQLSPRPYLLARTRAGVVVTDRHTSDHAHHYGVSAALPDVNGTSFWGGRTYVREAGSQLLDNHGVQRLDERKATADGVAERVTWLDRTGESLLTERRVLRIGAFERGWALNWRSVLEAESEVTFGSPQTNGRDGAFYGGLFWRTPFRRARAVCADGAGDERAHGSSSPWLALVSDHATLIARTPPGFPWFVRTEGYVGFGPAVAAAQRRVLHPGSALALELRIAVLDGTLADADLAAAAERLRAWEVEEG